MTPWQGMNRRQFPRVKLPCMITIKTTDRDRAFLTHTENIGAGGVCVVNKEKIKLLSEVHIELDLLDFEEHIKCPAKVVWCVQRREDSPNKPLFYDMGLEFIEIKDGDRGRVVDVVEKIAKKAGIVKET